ncbi:MAG: hypothetical protein MR799_06665 [Lachnospiraceae bacterium]|nr:hypothetical protein [Lachnospiraceae bacterium]
MKELRIPLLKKVINDTYVLETDDAGNIKVIEASAGTKSRMKNIINEMYDYAVEHEIVFENYAREFILDKSIMEELRKPQKEVKIFTKQEEEILWDDFQFEETDMILISLYSGLRPKELAELKIRNIDLEFGTMQGGLKSDAGKDRIIPIHPCIRKLVENV